MNGLKIHKDTSRLIVPSPCPKFTQPVPIVLGPSPHPKATMGIALQMVHGGVLCKIFASGKMDSRLKNGRVLKQKSRNHRNQVFLNSSVSNIRAFHGLSVSSHLCHISVAFP